MSPTPRTDAASNGYYTDIKNVARQLETELTAMTARAEKAEADTARLDWLLDHGAQTYHIYSNPLGGGISVKYHKDRDAIDDAMKKASK